MRKCVSTSATAVSIQSSLRFCIRLNVRTVDYLPNMFVRPFFERQFQIEIERFEWGGQSQVKGIDRCEGFKIFEPPDTRVILVRRFINNLVLCNRERSFTSPDPMLVT